MKHTTLKDKLTIIKLYNEFHQIKDIANRYGLPITKLRYWLKHQKEVIWRGKNRLSVNENYFDKIDNSNQAYIIGFICADGSVSDNPHGLSIELQHRDKQILDEIKKELSFKGDIKDSLKTTSKSGVKKYSRLRIHNKNLVNTLINYGINPRKTYKLSLPTCIGENNFRHFLRGYFDGDGCLYINSSEGKSCGPRYAVTIVCEKSFAYQLHSLLQKYLNIKFRIVKQNSEVIRSLVIDSALPVEKFMTWLYDDIENSKLRLERKYQKFLELKKLRLERNNFTRRSLTPAKVIEIRNLLKTNISLNKLSKQFQVNRGVIKSIKDETGYADVI